MGYRAGARFYDLFDTKGNIGFYVDLARVTDGSVLELGVGTGRVLFEIARLGKQVVGIDTSPAMLEVARAKLRGPYADLQSHCRLIEQDMRSFDLDESFGLIYSASSGLQEIRAEDLPRVFECVATHLADHGVLAFDVVSPTLLRKSWSGLAGSSELHDGRKAVRYIEQVYDKEADRTSVTITYEIVNADGKVVEKFEESGKLTILTREVIEGMLTEAGLKIKAVYGDFTGGSYNQASPWLVVVAGRRQAVAGGT